MTSAAFRQWHWQWCIAAGVVLALRVLLMGWYGILEWPDSGGYSDIGETLARLPSLYEVIVGHVKISSSRTIGYPLAIAAAMTVAGSAWHWAIACFQMIGLLFMLWWLYRLGNAMGMGRGFSAFAAGVFACSHLAIYEGSILTDALTTHLTVISISVVLVCLLEEVRPGVLKSMGAGLLFACAFLIREATLYLLPVVIVAFIILSIRRGWRPKDVARMLACFVLPVVLVWQGYMAMIEARTGYRGIATIGRTVYLMHPLAIEKDGRKLLQDPKLREAADATSSWYIYGHTREIDRYLSEKYKLNEWERLALAKTAYWQAWMSAPVAMAIEALKELRPKYATQLANPGANFIDVNVTEETIKRSFDSKESVFVKLIQTLFRLASTVIFACCVIGIPLYVLHPKLRAIAPENLDALAVCWLLFSALVGMYAMIHMEFRHFLQVQAFAVLSGLIVLRHVVLLCRQYFRRRARFAD